MQQQFGRVVLAVLVVFATLSLLRPAMAADARAPILWPSADIHWADSPAFKGAKIAVLWGDPKTGAYGSLKSLPAGAGLPVHSHTHDQKVVIVAGTMTLTIAGTAKDLGPGSFAYVPGGVEHSASCKAGADCVYFEEQPGASDVKLAAPAAKP